MDVNGVVLYLLEKNKKGVFSLDKTIYEKIHTDIDDAHFLGDTLTSIRVPESVAQGNQGFSDKQDTISLQGTNAK